MTEKSAKSIWDGVDKLYAEMLKGKAVTMTVVSVVECQIDSEPGKKKPGFRVTFQESKKVWEFNCVTVRRQMARAFGSDDIGTYAGRKIVIFPDKFKSKFGEEAVRVDVDKTIAANR